LRGGRKKNQCKKNPSWGEEAEKKTNQTEFILVFGNKFFEIKQRKPAEEGSGGRGGREVGIGTGMLIQKQDVSCLCGRGAILRY